jgi:hypothetical protein
LNQAEIYRAQGAAGIAAYWHPSGYQFVCCCFGSDPFISIRYPGSILSPNTSQQWANMAIYLLRIIAQYEMFSRQVCIRRHTSQSGASGLVVIKALKYSLAGIRFNGENKVS